MIWPFGRRRAQAQPAGPASLADLMAEAAAEVDRQIALDADWFQGLPYGGGMSRDEAREYEIEKLALWRRIIAEAAASDLAGLTWTTRGDDRVCPHCAAQEGRRFDREAFDELRGLGWHLGCRCELVPVRPKARP